MSRPRGISVENRPGNKHPFDIQTPLAGFGFALAFGWLWFPVLRDILLPGLFTGQASFFNPIVLGFAMAVGCFLYSRLCGSLENGAIRQRILNAVLAHGVPPLLLCLLLLLRSNGLSFIALDETLVGLAGALPGVWWTSRLLASGPGKAVASLAWAACTALVLSLPLSRQRPHSAVTVCILAAGLALACLAALFLVKWEREHSGEENALPGTVAPLETPYRFSPFRGVYALLLCGIVPIFFGLGSLKVLVHGTEGGVSAIARICALIAAVFLLDGPANRMFGIAACTLAILALCLPLAPDLAPMLFPGGAALLGAAGVALCAAALRRGTFKRDVAASLAGLFLTVTLAAVNGGYLAGWELAPIADKTWLVLPGLAAALLLTAVADQGRRRMAGIVPVPDGTEKESPPPHTAPGEAALAATTVSQLIVEQLTKREQALASLLANGYSNKAAAEIMGVKENTLRWHIKKLYKKIKVADREELIMILKENNAIYKYDVDPP